MSQLNQQSCEACQAGAPQVDANEMEALLKQIPEWLAVEIDDVMQLQRVFTFKNFRDALAFTNKVGELAETEGHHPALLTEWGKVTIYWWTHKIRGLHVNDFICAAKTDDLL